MSIQSEITRISGNVSDALTAISNKGVTVPSGSTSDDLADLIGQITGGGGASATTVVTTQDSHGGDIVTITTGIDISSDTVAADKLLYGYTAHDSTGTAITGSYTPPSPSLQSKTNISPTTSSQTITADNGYDGLSSVQINAMPSGSATTPATTISATPTMTVNSSTGLVSASVSTTKSVTPTISAGYVSAGTAGTITVSGSNSAQLTVQAATTYHPSTTDQNISSGRYLTGTQTFKAVTHNITAGIIKSGEVVKIGDSTDDDCVTSITGTYTGGGSSKAFYCYTGLASRTANSYGSTSATVTVTKAGTYTISYVAIRGSSSGTMGTNLHIGSSSGTNNTTWNNGTYGQAVTLTGQSISANTAVTIYATSGSTSRSIYVGQLIVQEE